MLKPFTAVVAATLTVGATAQTTTAPPSGGGLAGLLGGALPNIGSIGAGNAAGLVGYCLKNNLLGVTTTPAPAGTAAPAAPPATGAQAILERLSGRRGVQSSPAYAAGQAGQVQTANGRTIPLDGVRGQVKAQLCRLALNRARSFL